MYSSQPQTPISKGNRGDDQKLEPTQGHATSFDISRPLGTGTDGRHSEVGENTSSSMCDPPTSKITPKKTATPTEKTTATSAKEGRSPKMLKRNRVQSSENASAPVISMEGCDKTNDVSQNANDPLSKATKEMGQEDIDHLVETLSNHGIICHDWAYSTGNERKARSPSKPSPSKAFGELQVNHSTPWAKLGDDKNFKKSDGNQQRLRLSITRNISEEFGNLGHGSDKIDIGARGLNSFEEAVDVPTNPHKITAHKNVSLCQKLTNSNAPHTVQNVRPDCDVHALYHQSTSTTPGNVNQKDTRSRIPSSLRKGTDPRVYAAIKREMKLVKASLRRSVGRAASLANPTPLPHKSRTLWDLSQTENWDDFIVEDEQRNSARTGFSRSPMTRVQADLAIIAQPNAKLPMPASNSAISSAASEPSQLRRIECFTEDQGKILLRMKPTAPAPSRIGSSDGPPISACTPTTLKQPKKRKAAQSKSSNIPQRKMPSSIPHSVRTCVFDPPRTLQAKRTHLQVSTPRLIASQPCKTSRARIGNDGLLKRQVCQSTEGLPKFAAAEDIAATIARWKEEDRLGDNGDEFQNSYLRSKPSTPLNKTRFTPRKLSPPTTPGSKSSAKKGVFRHETNACHTPSKEVQDALDKAIDRFKNDCEQFFV